MTTDSSSASPLRVGVVGTAHWAQHVHAPGALAARDAELVAVWGRNAERAAAFAESAGVPAAESYEALLDAVDVVTFAVPPQVQPGLAVVAAEAGKHLLLEKPVATSVRAADELAAAVSEGGGHAAVFFTRRFVPELERRLQTATQQPWSSAHVAWHANFAAADSPYRDSVWRAEPLAALWDLTPHVLSQLIPVLGAVEKVSARRFGDGVVLRTRHAGGTHADISVSLNAADHVDEFRLLRADGTYESLTAQLDDAVDAVDAFARALDGLVATTRGGPEGPAPLSLGLEVTRILADAESQLR